MLTGFYESLKVFLSKLLKILELAFDKTSTAKASTNFLIKIT